MQRRINQWLQGVGAASYDEYIKVLQRDAEERERFTGYLTINTSQFYRDVTVFREIGDKGPARSGAALFSAAAGLSAGCSTGPEIYTIAMLLEELTPGTRHTLLGTDFDVGALEQAGGSCLFGKSAGTAFRPSTKRGVILPTKAACGG